MVYLKGMKVLLKFCYLCHLVRTIYLLFSESRTLLTSSDVKFILVKVGPIIFTIAGIVADRSSSDVCCTKYPFKRLA